MTKSKDGTFEFRESHATPDGPRSRTLATFRELDAETIQKVIARAEAPSTAEQLIGAALRAGASMSASPVDRAARSLLRSIARGEHLDPKLRRLLVDALSGDVNQAAEWLGASPAERGDALRDLLSLTDALPIRPRPGKIHFPHIDSTRRS